MSLSLLNVILSMDTKHGRPETVMHGPRERKKYRKRIHDFGGFYQQQGPPMKRRRSSVGSIGSMGMQSALLSIIFYYTSTSATTSISHPH